MSPSPAPESAPRARPVEAAERLVLLDVLRGFALGGVFLANAYVHMSRRALLPRTGPPPLEDSRADAIASFLFDQLVSGKAMSLFSFLFGLGFALQMLRAEQRGESIVPVYSRRLTVLLLVGLVHLLAFWHGDILTLYALNGFVLLLFRRLPDRRLLGWSFALLFLAPIAVFAVMRFIPPLLASPEGIVSAGQAKLASLMRLNRRTFDAFLSGDYPTTARANVTYYLRAVLNTTWLTYLLGVLGRFFLGLVAGRRRLFEDLPRHLPFFRRLLGWGLVLAVLGHGSEFLFGQLARAGTLTGTPLRVWLYFQLSLWEMGVVGLGAVYLAGLTLLFQRPRGQKVLAVLAPAGRMALTNYLLQTAVNQGLYYGYGLGLLGRVGPAACLLLMAALFAVQVLVSHLWLSAFRFGPAEWVWRCLTYGARQPLRRA